MRPTSFVQLFTVRFEGSAFQVSLFLGDRQGAADNNAPLLHGVNEWPLPLPDGGAVAPMPYEHITASGFDDGAWHRIELRLGNAAGGSPAYGVLLVDGSNVLAYNPSITAEMRGPVRLYGGLSYVVSHTEDVVVDYDNVEVRTE